MYQLQECRDQNEYQKGSLAELEMIKKHIKKNNIDEEKANEILNRHRKDREEYLKRIEEYPSRDYYAATRLPHDTVFVVRTQALIDFQKRLSKQESAKVKHLESRSERTYLNIIGALLEVVTGRFKDETFSSETQLREFIAEKFEGFRGTSSRTLAEKFALAKKAINDELD